MCIRDSPKASLEKRNDVLKSMNEIGELSDEDYEKAPVSYTHLDVYKRQSLDTMVLKGKQ